MPASGVRSVPVFSRVAEARGALRRTSALCAAFLLCSGLAIGATARQADAAPRRAAKARAASTKPVQIEGIKWHPDLRHALARSAPARKPVVWMRVLGDLAGAT